MTNVLTGTLSYDTEAKTLRLDTDELYPSQDYTLLYVAIFKIRLKIAKNINNLGLTTSGMWLILCKF